MNEEEGILRKSWLSKWPAAEDGFWYVVAFDVGATERQRAVRQRSFQEYCAFPEPYDEEYNKAFLQDLCRLLEDHARMRLILKPKRNPEDPRFLYTPELRKLIRRINEHERGTVLDQAIDPWLPLAMADACVVLPLTSPGLAALHYGVPIIYHDPDNRVRAHRFPSLEFLVTHDYATLTLRLKALHAVRASKKSGKDCRSVEKAASAFTGLIPATDSSVRFRRLLHDLAYGSSPAAVKDAVAQAALSG